jgi:hypothetical protein
MLVELERRNLVQKKGREMDKCKFCAVKKGCQAEPNTLWCKKRKKWHEQNKKEAWK